MKAFIVDRYGKEDGARLGEMPDPELRQDDVLVQVHAAGVNLLDSKIRKRKTSNSFCLIAYRSFWVMMWLGSWSEWDLEYGDSSLATRSMHGLHRIESVPSPNSSR